MKSSVRVRNTFCVLMAAVFLLFGTAGAAEAGDSRFYSWGSHGDTVREIQSMLGRWGYYTGPVDGIFGYKTYEAVLSFQKVNGLKQDGIAGKQTLNALGLYQGQGENEAGMRAVSSDGQSSRETDIWLLAKIINGEGRGENYIGQVAIGAVVMNRVRHAGFPGTIAGVIYQTGAFDAVKDGQFDLTPTESCVNAARDAYNGWDPVDGALFYWNPKTATNKWVQALIVTKTIGNHVFANN